MLVIIDVIVKGRIVLCKILDLKQRMNIASNTVICQSFLIHGGYHEGGSSHDDQRINNIIMISPFSCLEYLGDLFKKLQKSCE